MLKKMISNPSDSPAQVDTHLLEMRAVTKTFVHNRGRQRQDVPALDNVSFVLEPGESLAIVGETGAGKTTVARTIVGMEHPDTGKVVFEGIDLSGLRERSLRKLRWRIHLVFQDPYESLNPRMRVGRTVAEPLAIQGKTRDEQRGPVMDALTNVGLEPADSFIRRFPHELSGGQRQRVAVARALVVPPRLLIADEPTSMVDASLRGDILDLLISMRQRLRMAFVIITHDLQVARFAAERILVMRAGRIVESGRTEQVLASPTEEYTKLLLAAAGIA